MILGTMALISAVSFQAEVTKAVKENPKYVGKIVEICVDSQCVTVDRSEDVVLRDQKEPKEDGSTSGIGTEMGSVLAKVLDKVGGASGSISVDYKEATTGKNGETHSVEVKVEIKAGTGSGK